MVDTLRIKRRTTGAAGAPGGLANAEIAYNEVDNTLYYGAGGSAGAAAAILPIAGRGAYLPLTGGNLRGGIQFNSAVVQSPYDLSQHIELYPGYGFSITGSTLNYNSGIIHNWWIGNSNNVMTLQGSGLSVYVPLTVTGDAVMGNNYGAPSINPSATFQNGGYKLYIITQTGGGAYTPVSQNNDHLILGMGNSAVDTGAITIAPWSNYATGLRITSGPSSSLSLYANTITVSQDPTTGLGIATKQYVDARAFVDAPNNVYIYGRKGGAWSSVPDSVFVSAGSFNPGNIDATNQGLVGLWAISNQSGATGWPADNLDECGMILHGYNSNAGWQNQLLMGGRERGGGPAIWYRSTDDGGWTKWHRLFSTDGGTLTGALQVNSTIIGTNSIAVNSNGVPSLRMMGNASTPGYLEIFTGGGRVGYVGYYNGGNYLTLTAENGYIGWVVNGDLVISGITTLSADPTSALQAATKQYVDKKPSLTISDTAPGAPAVGSIWFDSVAAQTYLWYNDPNSSQWVPLNAPPIFASLPLTGGTVTGPTYFQGNPFPLHITNNAGPVPTQEWGGALNFNYSAGGAELGFWNLYDGNLGFAWYQVNTTSGGVTRLGYWARTQGLHIEVGPLVLPADPVNALEAATKQYVDNKPAQPPLGGPYLPLAGGTLSGGISFGNLTGSGNTDLTKHIQLYSNGAGGGYGFSVTGYRLNYNIFGANSTHYFISDGADLVGINTNGITVYSGDVNLRADPTTALQATTKQYVDNKAPLGGPYLPLIGGTVTGALQVNGNFTAGGFNRLNFTQFNAPNVPFTFIGNSANTRPLAADAGAVGSITWNYTGGGAEINFWNTYLGFVPSVSFNWYQSTSATAENQLATLGPNGFGIRGIGIAYNGVTGGGNIFGFAWSGSVEAFVDGNHIGTLAGQAWVSGNYLNLTGGSLTGGLHFGSVTSPSGNPWDTSRHITLFDNGYGFSITGGTLNYNSGQNHDFYVSTSRIAYFAASGLTIVQGNVTLVSDPTTALQAATKQYVDTHSGAIVVSDTPPASPRPGSLWFDSVGSQTYISYTDLNTSQWVPLNTPAFPAALPLTGGTLSGPLNIIYTPTDTSAGLWLQPVTGTNGLESHIRFGATFGTGISDAGVRYAASIRVGFLPSQAWGSEHLDIYINTGQNDGNSDAAQARVARFTNGHVNIIGDVTASIGFSAGVTGNGSAFLNPGAGNNPGYVAFFDQTATRVGYIGWTTGDNRFVLQTENQYTGWSVNGTFTIAGKTTTNSGIIMGSAVSGGPDDISRHISLWDGGGGTGYGFCVTNARLNYTIGGGATGTHFFRESGVDCFGISHSSVDSWVPVSLHSTLQVDLYQNIGNSTTNSYLNVNGASSGNGAGPSIGLNWGGTKRAALAGYSALVGGTYDSRTLLSGYDGLVFATLWTDRFTIDSSGYGHFFNTFQITGAPQWSTNNLACGLDVKIVGANPAIGISDSSGINYIGICNSGGSFAVLAMPLPGDAASAPGAMFSVDRSGNAGVVAKLNMGGGISFGQRTAASSTDNSGHISLYDGWGGFNITGGNLNVVAGGALNMSFQGGSATMQVPLYLAADPTAAMVAATKQYVDKKTVTISDTAPGAPVTGQLWWDSVGGELYVRYADANSSQWVPASNASGAAASAMDMEAVIASLTARIVALEAANA